MVRKVLIVGALFGLCTGAALAAGERAPDGMKLTARELSALLSRAPELDAAPEATSDVQTRAPLPCPAGSLYSQPADDGTGAWGAATSELALPNGDSYEVIENVRATPGSVTGLRWWGIYAFNNGTSWSQCTPTTVDFNFKIRVYTDEFCTISQVCEYTATVTGTLTGNNYGNFPLYVFNYTFPTACTFNDNEMWVSIQAQSNPNCWFLWAYTQNQAPGDNYCLIRINGQLFWDDIDPSICVLGTANPNLRGSCCNEALGLCADNVLLTDCVGADERFDATKTCAQLSPGCGLIPGACCAANGNCTEKPKGQCNAPGDRWFGSCTTCTPNPCCNVDCPPGYTAEGEPNCADGYIDNFNGGCNSTPEVFSTITCNSTICGKSGTYLVGTSQRRDTDWYKLILTTAQTVNATLVAEFEANLVIATKGQAGCSDAFVVASANGDCASFIDLSACLPPGEYYVIVTPRNFTGVPCGSEYTLEMTGCSPCTPPTGACCVNGVCVATNTEVACTKLAGVWIQGQTCPAYSCACAANGNVWMNGEPEYVTALSAERRMNGTQVVLDRWVVDDVPLTTNATINSFQWWTVELPTFNWASKADFIILRNDGPGGAPNTVVNQTLDVTNVTRVQAGTWNATYNVYLYTISGQNVALTPGTYWMGLRPVQNTPVNGQTFWATAVDKGSQVYCKGTGYGNGTSWVIGQSVFGGIYDVAFCARGTTTQPGCKGDMNCDGQVDFADIDRFIEALNYPGGVGWPYPSCPWLNGDCNNDGQVNFDDIEAFVSRIGATCP